MTFHLSGYDDPMRTFEQAMIVAGHGRCSIYASTLSHMSQRMLEERSIERADAMPTGVTDFIELARSGIEGT